MAETPRFSVPLADLEYGERELSEDIPTDWLAAVFEGTEAVPRGPGRLEVTLEKSGREVMVRGQATAAVTMPCARTLDPVPVDLSADVFLMLEPKTAASQPRPTKSKKKHAAPRTTQGPSKRREKEPERELDEADAARDTYDGERVVLDHFVKEFLLLELPMSVLREDLRSEATPAIEAPPEPGQSRPRTEALDPRLAPLADIAKRLREKKE